MKTLIVIDMQNDFIDGALGTPEAVAIVPNVKKKIEEYHKNGYNVIFTQDTHYDNCPETQDYYNYLETQEGKHLPVKHCLYGTHGWEITKEITDAVCSLISIKKHTFGYYEWIEFGKEFVYFNENGKFGYVDEIELVGLCTDICVISNAMILKAAFPEIPIVVDASCCAGVTPESHKNALEAMKMCQIEIRGE